MYEKHTNESEIVIKISPRNLERMIYILVIIGLIIFSIVEFNKKIPDCPVLNCTSNTTAAVAVPATQTVTNTTANTSAATTTSATASTSGKVTFSLVDVKLCIVNSTEDKGKISTVGVSIENGLSRDFVGKLEIYSALDSNDNDVDLTRYPIKTVSNIKISAGNTLNYVYTINAGMFNEITSTKSVKAVLVDSDINKDLGTQTKQNLKASGKC